MKSHKASTLLGLFAAFALGTPMVLAQSSAQPAKPAAQSEHAHSHAKTEKKSDKLEVGKKAPEFSLPDTDGKEHTLASSAGKVVVLTWFNADCPYVVKHFEANKTFTDMNKKYGDKVTFFAINSNAPGKAGSGKDRNVKAKKDWSINFPILLDESGETGKAYNSHNTPYTVVIAADGTVAYTGAPDDDRSETLGKTNYVAKAIDELLAGKPVTTKTTAPYGCAVKYKN